MRIYYFGVENPDRKGHYFFKEGFKGGRFFDELDEEVERTVYPQIDTGFCPKTEPYQKEGAAKLTHTDNLTILGFWDRSGDPRGGCNSNFIAVGTHSFSTMIEEAKKAFPTIFERINFEIKEYKEQCETQSA
jgi:hypothetical protein